MKVSIIVTSYNYGKYIGETLESLLAQTFSDWQAIVIDDGSSDDSVAIIKQFTRRDARIKLLQHPGGVNKGLPASLELGVRHAEGEYVAFCESDDMLAPESIESQVNALDKNPGVALSFTCVELLGSKSDIDKYQSYIEKVRHLFLYSGEPVSNRKVFAKMDPVFTFSCAMVRADLLKQCDFDSPYAPFLDWWLWRQLCYNNDFIFIDLPLTRWRIHGESFLQSVKDVAGRQKEFRRLSSEFLKSLPSDYLQLQPDDNNPTAAGNTGCIPLKAFNLIKVPFGSYQRKQDFSEIRLFGYVIHRSFYWNELNHLLRKRAIYRFYSFFPIPLLQKKLKRKYKSIKLDCSSLKEKYFWVNHHHAKTH